MAPSPSLDADLTRLLLRASVGGTLIAHGVKHAHPDWHGGMVRVDRVPAAAAAGAAERRCEIGAGAAVLAGAATPLSTAAVVGTMAVAARSVHVSNGFFITREG